jgi:hypothetical protein
VGEALSVNGSEALGKTINTKTVSTEGIHEEEVLILAT